MAEAAVSLASFQELSEAHGALLEAQSDDKLDPSAVRVFVTEAAAAGAQIESIADRDAVRSMINYWTAVLARLPRPANGGSAAGGAPDLGLAEAPADRPTLARFDASLSPDLPDEDNPFVGLSAFDQGQRGLYYGRDSVIVDLLKTCAESSFVVVSGASGTGKSSLVRAGLIAAVQADTAYADWLVAIATPGRDPLASLVTALAPQGPDASDWIDQARRRVDERAADLAAIAGQRMGAGHLLLVIDQFEEIFSLCAEGPRDQAAIGIAALAALPRAHVVITIRDEYLEGEKSRHLLPAELDLAKGTEFRIPPLTPAEIRAAIEGPASNAGLIFQDGLIDRIVSDVGTDPAALPLLQYTLLRLWQKRQGNRVTNEIYDQIGCLSASLSTAAQETYDGLGTDQARNNARIVFEQLVRPSLTYEFVRDRVTRAELQTLLPPENLNTVLQAFEKVSLLRITRAADRDEDRIEIVHEALIRNWDLLRRWSLECREQERAYLSLDAMATQWSESGKKIGNLLFGRALIDAEHTRTAYEGTRIRSDPVAKAQVDAFLAESKIRQRWLASSGLIVLLTALLIIVSLAYVNKARERALALTVTNDQSTQVQLGDQDAIIAQQRASLVAQGGPLVGESARQFIQMLLSRGTIAAAELPIEFADMTPVAAPWPAVQAGARFDDNFLALGHPIVPTINGPGVREMDLPNARIFYDSGSGMPLLVASQSDRSQAQSNAAPNALYAYPGLEGQPDEAELAREHLILAHLVDRREVNWGPNGLWAARATNLLPMMVRMPERTTENQPFGPWLKLGQWLRGNHNPTASRVVYLSGAVPPDDRSSRLAPPKYLWKAAISVDGDGKLIVDAAMLPAQAGAPGDLPGRTTLDKIAAVSGLDFSALTGARPSAARAPQAPAASASSTAAPPAAATPRTAAPARIYTEVKNVPDEQAAAIVLLLANAGYRMPPIQQVDGCVSPPQLRYYYEEDQAAAEKAAAAATMMLAKAGFVSAPVKPLRLSLKTYANARPAHFELWLCGAP